MGCKFERVKDYIDSDLPMPVRKTAGAAAYDICAAETVTIPSFFNSIVKMLSTKITDSEFTNKIDEIAKEVQGDIPLLLALEAKDNEALAKEAQKYFDRFQGDFTLDLNQMKALVKAAGTKLTLVPTGVKCKLEDDQVLHLYIRSSCPLNHYLFLGNGTGVIDSDYYNNEDNEGHIFFQIINLSPFNIVVKKGDIIGQGEITRFCKTDDDEADGVRTGGFGSTNA
jgi:dUTP pyrophosphatase